MATVLSEPEQRIILPNVSWKTYDQLMMDHTDCSAPRFTYDRGVLEITSPSAKHEELNRMIALIVSALAEEWDIDIRGFGSTTFRREDLERGFETGLMFLYSNRRSHPWPDPAGSRQ